MPYSWHDIAAMRRLLAFFVLLGLGSGAAAEVIPLPRPRPPAWVEPLTFREAAGPDFNSAEVTSQPTGCDERLANIAFVAPMPRLVGPGACGGRDMVELDAVLLAGGSHIAVKPAPVLRCEMAEQFIVWIRDEAAPRMIAAGLALRSVENYDDFECRGRNRVVGARLSEHGMGNAIDVRSFTLADGRVFRLTDIAAPKDLRAGLRESACRSFNTVLGPGSDGHHEEHIHLDIAARRNGYRICEWAVREPPPPEIASAQIDGRPVPLPTPKPVIPFARKL
jgi:hypothetical protein